MFRTLLFTSEKSKCLQQFEYPILSVIESYSAFAVVVVQPAAEQPTNLGSTLSASGCTIVKSESGLSHQKSFGDNQSDTDLTEFEDDAEQSGDINDAALLFADNEHLPEYYIRQFQDLTDETVYTQEDYGKGTTALLDRIEEKWTQLSGSCMKGPLPTRLGIMNRRMRRVIRRLAKKYKLSIKGREKPPMDVEDLAKVVETAVSTTKKRFGHGRHRIELRLFLQLAGLTTNRPQAILDLQYHHIQVSLLHDPHGGPHRIVIEFTFEFTKEWLGAKDANTYILPEIIFDPSLVLSSHVFLLGLLFADRAFDRADGEEVLVSAKQLPRLQIRDQCNKLRLQLDPMMDDVPVLGMSERSLYGIGISPCNALPYSTIEPWVKRMGVITGIKQTTRPYSLRYGAGSALDSSASVSDSFAKLGDASCRYSHFLKSYLSRRISKNLPAIIRGLDPEEHIMRAACRMSRTIDPDRP
ncbi:hypothetical protein N7451_012514 [Penicillium sp. IBT 35674x]|nr:hypothetical protein N7451_012514 [Penicillium sp. IBT 35674x]